jgi:hypothetical protein
LHAELLLSRTHPLADAALNTHPRDRRPKQAHSKPPEPDFPRPFPSSHAVEHGWPRKFWEVHRGVCAFRLQVYSREESEEFAMSCYDADVAYCARRGLYMAVYLKLGQHPRTVEFVTHDRLRLVPPPLRRTDPYGPYGGGRCDRRRLAAGDSVEVQWRLHHCHAFGWWMSTVLEVTPEAVTFYNRQYSDLCHWSIIRVDWPENLSEEGGGIRRDPGGGYLGGVRRLSECEVEGYMPFLPEEPLFPV